MGSLLEGIDKFMSFYIVWIFIELVISIVRSVFSHKAQKAYFSVFDKDMKSYSEFYKKHPVGKKATVIGYFTFIPSGLMILSLFLLWGKTTIAYEATFVILLLALIAEASLEITRAVLDIIYANMVISAVESGKLKKEDAPSEASQAGDAPKALFCESCGAPIKEDSMFCEGCGAKLK